MYLGSKSISNSILKIIIMSSLKSLMIHVKIALFIFSAVISCSSVFIVKFIADLVLKRCTIKWSRNETRQEKQISGSRTEETYLRDLNLK